MNITLNWWDSKNKIEDNDHCIEQINDFSRKFKLVKKMYENWKVAIKMISWRKLEWREYENFINEYKKIQKEYDDYFNTYDNIMNRYQQDNMKTQSIIVDTFEKLNDLFKNFQTINKNLQRICLKTNKNINSLMDDVVYTRLAIEEKDSPYDDTEYKEYLKYEKYVR